MRVLRVVVASLVLLGGNQLGRSKSVAPTTGQPFNQPWAVTPGVAKDGEGAGEAKIWVVEETASHTLYSNGLTVRREHEAESVPRRYRVYRRDTLVRSEEKNAPAGIVFHTTESLILPLEAGQNRALLRSRGDVLEHARRGRLYNFVIDRFGQVSRIVPEGQTALHAGHSVWASGDSVWVDLNESFLGVSFEAKSGEAKSSLSKSSEGESAEPFVPSAAQVHAGRLLTEVLLARFAIAKENCVTHAQVSVNPDNMRIGYHTDWGSAFPFQAIGLQDNYRLPVAAVAVFGFRHDEVFLRAIEDRTWAGLLTADADIAARAAREGLTANEYSTQLQQLYKTFRRERHG